MAEDYCESCQIDMMAAILSQTGNAYDISVIPMISNTYGNSKEQAVKVLEEAAEVVEAWKKYNETKNEDGVDWLDLATECADVIQAVVNLLYSCEIPPLAFRVALANVYEKNTSRGRKYLGG